MATEDPQKDWRLDKYIGALDEMVTSLKELPSCISLCKVHFTASYINILQKSLL